MNKKYEPEAKLIEKVQSGEYGWKDYIKHHSPAMEQDYENFCKFRGLDPNEEESAEQYMEIQEKTFEEALETENA